MTGKPLGVVFNWDGLGQTIVERVPLSPDELQRTRVCITDGSRRVLADSHGRQLKETLAIPNQATLFREARGNAVEIVGGRSVCFAHARSPGFETYATGWHSLLICEL